MVWHDGGVGERYDVFLSHAWGDHLYDERMAERPHRGGVERLRDALRAHGLKVFYDEGSIDDFAPLAATILESLRNSTVLVSWCSDLYLSRPACASELTQAMCWSVDSEAPRVLVVNTEADVGHLPAALRASLIPSAPDLDDDEGLAALVGAIAERCAAIDEIEGDGLGAAAIEAPPWYPEKIASSTRFTGRFAELWELHSLLTNTAMHSSKDSRDGVVISGIGGSGKSLLVLEYAHRFGAAWPGGVVFLGGHGADRDDSDDEASSAAHALHALGELAAGDLQVQGVADMDLAQLRAVIQQWFENRGRVLWIVDDLADNADTAAWVAPMDDAVTIFTTRVRTYDGLFDPLHLGELSEHDATKLLTRDHPPTAPDQIDASETITDRLGRHALAVDVTRCRVRTPNDYAHLLERLDERTIGLLERAGKNVGDLPVDHTTSITATLQSSIDDLTPLGHELLDICTCFDSLPLPDDAVAVFAALLTDGDRDDIEADTIDGLADLERHSLARRSGTTTLVHRLVVDIGRPDDDRRSFVLDRAANGMSYLLGQDLDERTLRSLRPHHELAMTLPLDLLSPLPIWMARFEVGVGNPAEAVTRLEQLWAERHEELGERALETLAVRHELATARIETGHYEVAITHYEEVLDARRELLGPLDPDTLESLHGLGVALFWYDGKDTQEVLEEALAGREEVLGADHVDTVTTRHYLGRQNIQTEQLDRGIELLAQVTDDRERLLGADHLDTLDSRHFYWQAVAMNGDMEQATRGLESVLAVMDKAFGPDHRSTLATRATLAEIYRVDGDAARSVAEMVTIVADTERALGPTHQYTLEAYDLLAVAHAAAGNHAEAIPLFERVLPLHVQSEGPDHPTTVDIRLMLAEAAAEVGDHDTAVEQHELVLEAMIESFGRRSRSAIDARLQLAKARRARRRAD